MLVAMRVGRRALSVAATYFAVACAYIVVSSHVAAAFASNVADMERVERVKGIVFVFVTAAAVYAAAYVALRRAHRDAREIERHQQRIVESERLATAGLMAAG